MFRACDRLKIALNQLEEILMKLLTFRPRVPAPAISRTAVGLSHIGCNALAGASCRDSARMHPEGDSALARSKLPPQRPNRASRAASSRRKYSRSTAVTFEAPLIPGKIMAVGRITPITQPSSVRSTPRRRVIKVSSCVVAHGAHIRKPAWTETFDYENELAIVIGVSAATSRRRRLRLRVRLYHHE